MSASPFEFTSSLIAVALRSTSWDALAFDASAVRTATTITTRDALFTSNPPLPQEDEHPRFRQQASSATSLVRGSLPIRSRACEPARDDRTGGDPGGRPRRRRLPLRRRRGRPDVRHLRD